MNLTTDQLNEIKELAEALIPPRTIAEVMDLNIEEFIQSVKLEGSEVRKSFLKGQLKSMVENNLTIITAAKNGSSQAQMQLLELILTMNNQLI
jgi:hypothetical protein